MVLNPLSPLMVLNPLLWLSPLMALNSLMWLDVSNGPKHIPEVEPSDGAKPSDGPEL